MALLECNFFAESLGMCSSMNVVLPQPTLGQIGLKGTASGGNDGFPVLYLLHGMSDDHTIWIRRTSVERYATQYGIAIVMPNVHRSYYSDMACGLKYWQFVSEELPAIVKSFFHVSDKREDTFVAGLSMGGFGALKLGLNKPEKFAACASLSGAICPRHLAGVMPDRQAEFKNIFGDISNIEGSINDLYHVSEKLAEHKQDAPEIFMTCGTSDFLYDENLRFKAHLEKIGLEFVYREGPGTHEWGYWDKEIQEVIRWLPLKNRKRV